MALRRPKEARQAFPGRGVTASVAALDLSGASSWKTWTFGNKGWQDDVWRLYDIVPEHHFLLGRIGDSVAKARLYVTEVDDTGEETGEVAEERIRQLAAVPLGTGAQRDECLRLAGIDLAGPGEAWIVGEGAAVNPEKAQGSWFVVTGSALKREGGQGGAVKVRRPRSRGGDWMTLTDGVDILIRCWGAHPNDVDQADSPSRASIAVLREIELLTKRVFAELDSRLTGAGVMFLPEGVDFPREQGDPEGLAGFMAYLQRSMAASIRDQSSAQALVPIMATLPDHMMEHVESMKPINFWSELSADIGPMRDRAIARLAASFELPNEVLTGISDANHWTAWLISEEGIRWIGRYLGLIADALTRGFLRRALESMGVANPERYAFTFDTSTLAARPNRLEEATVLHDRHLISDAELVKAGAFDVEQMPKPEELTAQRLWELVKTQPDLVLDPAVQSALGLPKIESVGLPPTSDQNADSEPVGGRNGPPNGGAAPEVPTESETEAITAALGARIASLAARPAPAPQAVLNASAKLLIFRALELAGGRLATPAERRGRWRDVPRHELHARIGPITPDRADRVTEGAWNHVPLVAADLGVNPDDLHRLLSTYVRELLVHGRAHDDDLLFGALTVANRGRGLIAA